MVDPYLVRLRFVKTLIDKGYFGKENFEMIPDLDEEKHALSDLYSGLGVCKVVDSRVVHIAPETAEVAIRCIEYYIQQMTN